MFRKAVAVERAGGVVEEGRLVEGSVIVSCVSGMAGRIGVEVSLVFGLGVE